MQEMVIKIEQRRSSQSNRGTSFLVREQPTPETVEDGVKINRLQIKSIRPTESSPQRTKYVPKSLTQLVDNNHYLNFPQSLYDCTESNFIKFLFHMDYL